MAQNVHPKLRESEKLSPSQIAQAKQRFQSMKRVLKLRSKSELITLTAQMSDAYEELKKLCEMLYVENQRLLTQYEPNEAQSNDSQPAEVNNKNE